MGPVSLQSSCLNIKYYHSTLKYLSFKVLHDNTNQNHDFTHFRGTPILGGSKKGVRGVKKIGPQHFRVLYTLRVLQTKNQKMNTKIERRVVFLTLRHALKRISSRRNVECITYLLSLCMRPHQDASERECSKPQSRMHLRGNAVSLNQGCI